MSGKFGSVNVPLSKEYVITIDKERYPIIITQENDLFIVDIQVELKQNMDIDFVAQTTWNVGETIFDATLNNSSNVTMQLLKREGCNLTVVYMGTKFHVLAQSPKEDELQKFMPVRKVADLSKMVIAPMPGAIVRVNVHPGDKVANHQEILVVEAMKMQNSIRAHGEAVVKKVNVKAGDIVSNGQALVEFE